MCACVYVCVCVCVCVCMCVMRGYACDECAGVPLVREYAGIPLVRECVGVPPVRYRDIMCVCSNTRTSCVRVLTQTQR